MYRYHDNSDKYISLHDCRATKASLENNLLSLYFPEGLWIDAKHPDNSYQQAAYTGDAKIDFHLLYPADDAVTIYVFTQETPERAIREVYELNQFISDLNNDIYQLEFLYTYQGYQTIKYDCWLWMKEAPYHKECELIISTNTITYNWNELYIDSL